MNRILVLPIAIPLLAGVALSQSAPPQGKETAGGRDSSSVGQLQAGSVLQAELNKPIDVRKNKPADEVVATVTHDAQSNGVVVVPKGSKIVGHVIEVKARSKDQLNSVLRLTFDRVVLKNGGEIPAALGIQAIGSRQVATGENELASGTSNVSPGGLLGGVGSPSVGAASEMGSAKHSAGLTAASQGVVGLPGLTLSNQSSTPTQAASNQAASNPGSVISSTTRDVRLDNGTQLILRVNQ
jgi:hypothetical protein